MSFTTKNKTFLNEIKQRNTLSVSNQNNFDQNQTECDKLNCALQKPEDLKSLQLKKNEQSIQPQYFTQGAEDSLPNNDSMKFSEDDSNLETTHDSVDFLSDQNVSFPDSRLNNNISLEDLNSMQDFEEIRRNDLSTMSTATAKDAIVKWMNVWNLVQKWHPQKAVVNRAAKLFDEDVMCFFYEYLFK